MESRKREKSPRSLVAGARRFSIPGKGWRKKRWRALKVWLSSPPSRVVGFPSALTGNTCIVVALSPPPLVSRRRCTRSVYSRDFLEGAAPFEGVPFSGDAISRGFFVILEIGRSWNHLVNFPPRFLERSSREVCQANSFRFWDRSCGIDRKIRIGIDSS